MFPLSSPKGWKVNFGITIARFFSPPSRTLYKCFYCVIAHKFLLLNHQGTIYLPFWTMSWLLAVMLWPSKLKILKWTCSLDFHFHLKTEALLNSWINHEAADLLVFVPQYMRSWLRVTVKWHVLVETTRWRV